MSDDTPTLIAIDEADFASLKHYAETICGIEVKAGTNGAQVRAKIAAVKPEITEIPVVAAAPVPQPKAPRVEATAPAGTAPKYSVNNPGADPKVRIIIDRTSDTTRSKTVLVGVNGYTWHMQRGAEIEVPYRAYLALANAIEKRAVLSDREGPFGTPQYDYQDELSYPFRVLAMPTEAEILAWHAETGKTELRAEARMAA